MNRRYFFASITVLCLAAAVTAGWRNTTAPASRAAHGEGNSIMTSDASSGNVNNGSGGLVERSDKEWRELLTPEQYYVTREKGTERAFSGEYWDAKTPGVYHCVCCGAPLFSSDTKYESGTGWPSFFAPLEKDALKLETDYKLIWPRTEVLCRRCDAHLGHVFDDGPEPTRQRYCLNSAALRLEAADEGPAANEENPPKP